MGSRKLAVQIHSVHANEDISTERLKSKYLNGDYTEFETRRKRRKIQRLVRIELEERIVKSVVIEWKDHHLPESELVSEYRDTCEKIAIERQHSTVTPSLQTKIHRIEDIILQRLE